MARYSAVDEAMRPAAMASTMPPSFKHALIGIVQVSLLLLFCAAIGIFTAQESTNEFLGHLLPGSILVTSGVLAMVGPADLTRLVRWEGWLGVVAGVSYVAGDTFYSHPPWGVFGGGAGSAEQFHVAFTSLMAAIGLFVILYVRALGRSTALHVVVLAAAFSLFVAGHHQHSAASVLAHNGSALFAIIAAIFRVMGRRAEYGVSIILAAYLFFAGQVGFVAFMTRFEIDPVPWVAGWTAMGAFVAAAYLAAFPGAAREVG